MVARERRDGNKEGRTDPEKVLYKERKIKRLQKEGIDKERRDKEGMEGKKMLQKI